jgi:hypothetical protein
MLGDALIVIKGQWTFGFHKTREFSWQTNKQTISYSGSSLSTDPTRQHFPGCNEVMEIEKWSYWRNWRAAPRRPGVCQGGRGHETTTGHDSSTANSRHLGPFTVKKLLSASLRQPMSIYQLAPLSTKSTVELANWQKQGLPEPWSREATFTTINHQPRCSQNTSALRSRFNLVSSVFVQGSSRRCKEHPEFLQLGREGAFSERLGNPAFTVSWKNESSPWRKVPIQYISHYFLR